MSFKLNDYNAFLTSLFDKNNQHQQQLEQLKHTSTSPQLVLDQHIQQDSQQQDLQQPQRHIAAEPPQQDNETTNNNKVRSQSMPHVPMSMNDEGRFPLHFDFGLIAPTFTYGATSNGKGKSISLPLPQEYGNVGTPTTDQDEMSGNMTEFIAEMGAERDDARYHSSNLADSMVLENSVTSPDNLFSLAHIPTNASSYTSDFAPIEEEPQPHQQQQQQQQQHQIMQANRLSHDNSLDSLESVDTNLSNSIKQDNNSVLGFQTSEQLTKRAANITFGVGTPLTKVRTESPPTSPLNQFPKYVSQKAPRKSQNKILDDYTHGNGSFNPNNPIQQQQQQLQHHHNHPGRPRVKSAHNVIEQRYRNKINDKFNALQNSVPTLRILAQRKEREKLQMKQQHHLNNESAGDEYDSMSDEEVDLGLIQDDNIDLEGLEPARKLNKGTILAKSIEYIKFLELKNDKMKQENDQLAMKARMLGLNIDDDDDDDEKIDK
ncbi:uncharacterized protein J8A68_004992 [[Candida] subhashii]|uniref:BHLH domain-containing protein n=1 Tax=[Candida] subhashii TaxID=561895 RepID=A0A8J5UEW5_9ASCO|nr:uncharacterized protein J8A68_004992 [[Candida] subhashii]KAG7661533.1 hypothetical protein J8A68_004992 [[Candida] subhashii]